MMRLKSDLLELLRSAANGELDGMTVAWRDEAALTVVMATKGYPGSPQKGSVISGISDAADADEVEIFHAGTALVQDKLTAAGGRVLNVTALGATVGGARDTAYSAIGRIDWPEGFFRRDIGWREVERENAE